MSDTVVNILLVVGSVALGVATATLQGFGGFEFIGASLSPAIVAWL